MAAEEDYERLLEKCSLSDQYNALEISFPQKKRNNEVNNRFYRASRNNKTVAEAKLPKLKSEVITVDGVDSEVTNMKIARTVKLRSIQRKGPGGPAEIVQFDVRFHSFEATIKATKESPSIMYRLVVAAQSEKTVEKNTKKLLVFRATENSENDEDADDNTCVGLISSKEDVVDTFITRSTLPRTHVALILYLFARFNLGEDKLDDKKEKIIGAVLGVVAITAAIKKTISMIDKSRIKKVLVSSEDGTETS